MKYFLNLLLILLLLSCNNAGNKSSKAKLESVTNINTECIESILKKDSVLGQIRNHASEQISLSETIDNYTNSLKSLDYSDCPDNFTIAFHEHIEAWLELKKASDKYPELRGELHEVFSELEKKKDSLEFKSFETKILDTWETVEKITKG